MSFQIRPTSLIVLGTVCTILCLAPIHSHAVMVMKTETFDFDPGWDGRNNRATSPPPATVTQNFGFSNSSNAGGPSGEIGGFITPAGEPAYYAQSIPVLSLDQPLTAAGTLKMQGQGNSLLGFFNSSTVNEWRTPNSLALRLYGRDSHFNAWGEYATSKWRAGARALGPGGGETNFNISAVHNWSLTYDPSANGGGGAITASIGSITTVTNLDPGHKLDGASFNRFGLLNIVKSYDGPGRVWVDNLRINGGATQTFSSDPGYEGLRNRTTYTSTNVRPRFDFGYSATTNFAGGAGTGEMGGHTFRGDSGPGFLGQRMAYYGDRLQQTLDLTTPLKASGKVAFRRGVTDSTTLIGFFHSTDSNRNSTDDNPIPENFMGAAIEGPSAEGFLFYPAYGIDHEGESPGERGVNPPYIYPDGTVHDWTLEYDPTANGGGGRLTISLDGHIGFMDLLPGHKAIGAHFDRFGIITTHRDGNGQTVYFDDLTYTVAIPEPSAAVGALMLFIGVFRARRTRGSEQDAGTRQ
jgi:hypothetical protein